MSVMEFNFRSKVLSYDTAMNIIIPETLPSENGYRVLWLLHGLKQNNTTWCRKSNIERYVENTDIAVVMPDGFRSFYTNMKSSHRYWDYISEEIPQLVYNTFNFSKRREDNFVCGLSMGGYGAIKLGLHFPERYSTIGSLSGALNVAAHTPPSDTPFFAELANVFGSEDELKGSDNDLMYVLKNKTDIKSIPNIYLACGSDDYYLNDSRKFYELAKCKGAENIVMEENAGDHNWIFWDEHIKHFLKFADKNIEF